MPDNFSKQHHMETLKVMDQCRGTFIAKNTDYGGSFAETYLKLGIVSPLTRLHDKLNRATNLITSKEQKVSDESIEDTLEDLANYAMMTVAAMRITKKEEADNAMERP